jgi:hypothetical protein
MPGNYPKTDEERRAAAIRYGMRPEDYMFFLFFFEFIIFLDLMNQMI